MFKLISQINFYTLKFLGLTSTIWGPLDFTIVHQFSDLHVENTDAFIQASFTSIFQIFEVTQLKNLLSVRLH